MLSRRWNLHTKKIDFHVEVFYAIMVLNGGQNNLQPYQRLSKDSCSHSDAPNKTFSAEIRTSNHQFSWTIWKRKFRRRKSGLNLILFGKLK